MKTSARASLAPFSPSWQHVRKLIAGGFPRINTRIQTQMLQLSNCQRAILSTSGDSLSAFDAQS